MIAFSIVVFTTSTLPILKNDDLKSSYIRYRLYYLIKELLKKYCNEGVTKTATVKALNENWIGIPIRIQVYYNYSIIEVTYGKCSELSFEMSFPFWIKGKGLIKCQIYKEEE